MFSAVKLAIDQITISVAIAQMVAVLQLCTELLFNVNVHVMGVFDWQIDKRFLRHF